MSDVENTINSFNGYHDDILEALRNAHRDLKNFPAKESSTFDEEALRKTLIDGGYNEQYMARRNNQVDPENPDDDEDEDIPPTCGTIRIRTLEDIIRQLEHHSTRHISPIESDELRLSENENDQQYRVDSSVCSESSQG